MSDVHPGTLTTISRRDVLKMARAIRDAGCDQDAELAMASSFILMLREYKCWESPDLEETFLAIATMAAPE